VNTTSEQGRVYFVDHNSKTTTWIDPRESQLNQITNELSRQTEAQLLNQTSQTSPSPFQVDLNAHTPVAVHRSSIVTDATDLLRTSSSSESIILNSESQIQIYETRRKQRNKMFPPYMVPDSARSDCTHCHLKFGVLRRRVRMMTMLTSRII